MKRAFRLFLLAACSVGSLVAADIRLESNGAVRLGDSDLVLTPVVFLPGWQSVKGVATSCRMNARELDFAFKTGAKTVATGHVAAVARAGAARFDWRYDLPADQTYLSLGATALLPLPDFAGTELCAGTARATIPVAFGKTHFFSASGVTNLTVRRPDGTCWSFVFPQPTDVAAQDNRAWKTASCSLRIGRLSKSVTTGAPFVWSAEVVAPDPVRLLLPEPTVIRPSERWIPLDYEKDIEQGSALDFSGLGLREAPAGKYGGLRAVGDHFEFEKRPGCPQRFYGVNFVGSMNFPTHAEADRIVTRLVRLGYNAVRFHHHDNGCVEGSADRVSLNAANMDRFDYFFAQLIRNGLYVTTDLYVSRRFTRGELGLDGEAKASVHINLVKALFALHEPAYRLLEDFARNFLTHRNPYTGRTYAEEPALCLLSLVNENTMGGRWEELTGERVFQSAWSTWLAKERTRHPEATPAELAQLPFDRLHWGGTGAYTAVLDRFAAEKEAALFARLRTFLRSLGVRALLTNQNNGRHAAAHQIVAAKLYDYIDDHFYVDHPTFLATPWKLPSRCPNANPIAGGVASACRAAFARHADKPFVLTEYNFAGPGRFRGVGGLLTGALGALQDWDGLWRFAYAHDVRKIRDGWGAPHYFDLATDPLAQAADRASLLLFLRGDLPPLTNALTLTVSSDAVYNPPDQLALPAAPRWMDAAWRLRVGARRAGGSVAAGPSATTIDLVRVAALSNAPVACAANPALCLDRAKGRVILDTPRTQGGFTEKGEIRATDFTATVAVAPATVWASSLDGKPLARASRVLVTHLTDVQGDGATYADEERQVLLAWGRCEGKGLALCENGWARVELKTPEEDLDCEVWELATSGRRIRKLACVREKGALCFEVSTRNRDGRARICYEVLRTPAERIAAGADWVVCDNVKDVLPGSAHDFSALSGREAPAGKYGGLRAVGDHFEFEKRPGRPQRFYGVNLVSNSNYLPHDLADTLVERLVRTGYNALRIHHHDGGSAVSTGSRTDLDPDAMEKLDYLIARAIDAGLYVTTDLFVSRRMTYAALGLEPPAGKKATDVFPFNAFKQLAAVWEPATRNLETYARNFLTHRNPYTGRTYAEEPALCLLSLVNEGATWFGEWETISREPHLLADWRAWLAEARAKGARDLPAADAGFIKGGSWAWGGNVHARYVADRERRFYARFTRFLRGLGCKALFTNQNCGGLDMPMNAVRSDLYDYVDLHWYKYHPTYKPHGVQTVIDTRDFQINPYRPDSLFTGCELACRRHLDKPFVVTEFNYAYGGTARSTAGLTAGAFAALQGWSGLWRFAYCHHSPEHAAFRNGVGVPSRFDLVTDPLMRATERAFVPLFLRGDMPELKDALALKISAASLNGSAAHGEPVRAPVRWANVAWRTKLGLVCATNTSFARAIDIEAAHARETPPFAASPIPAVAIDEATGDFAIQTPRTQGGYSESPTGCVHAAALTVRFEKANGSAWVTALDDRPVATSGRLLFSYLTDLRATGFRAREIWEGPYRKKQPKRAMTSFGDLPLLARDGVAHVTLALENPADCEVWRLAENGARLYRVPTHLEKGALSFDAPIRGRDGKASFTHEIIRRD